MRRTALAMVVCGLAAAVLGACGDDDGTGSVGATSTADRISTDGPCALIDAGRASEVLGVRLDAAVAGEGTCTYTSTTSPTAFTLQLADQGTNEPALVLETLGGVLRRGHARGERTFPEAEGGFTCLAGGVPNVVAIGHGKVVVLTGNSRDAGVTAEAVVAHLATLLEETLPRLKT